MARPGDEATLEYLALPLHSQEVEDFSAENVATPAKYRTGRDISDSSKTVPVLVSDRLRWLYHDQQSPYCTS
jgi:hypothetical protein